MAFFQGAAGGVIGGIGSTISSIVNARQNRKNVLDTIKAQKQAADLEWARNLEQWNRENEWNLPKNQMQRLREAGLNPNLIAEGASKFGTAATSPSYNASRPDYSQRESILGSALSTLRNYNDIRLQNAQIDNVQAMYRNTMAKWDYQALFNSYLKEWERDPRLKGFMKFERWFDSMLKQREGAYQQSIQNANYRRIDAEFMDMWKGTSREIFDYIKDKIEKWWKK